MVRRGFAAGLLLVLAACTGPQNASPTYKYNHLASYPGLQEQVAAYYAANALEDDGDCSGIGFDGITDSKVLGTEGPRTRVAVHYYYAQVDGQPGGGCNGFNTRVFTFERNTAGGYEVVDMSGPRRTL